MNRLRRVIEKIFREFLTIPLSPLTRQDFAAVVNSKIEMPLGGQTGNIIAELAYYHDLHKMGEIRGRMDLYLIGLMMQTYYADENNFDSLDADGREIVAYIRSPLFYKRILSNRVYPLPPFMESSNSNEIFGDALFPYLGSPIGPVDVNEDQSGLWYATLNGRKIYLGGSEAESVRYWSGILFEQDSRHPHCYCDEESGFFIDSPDGEIVADIGAAEGFFTLAHMEHIKYAYIFEASDHWYRLLEKTYAPYRDKVMLVKAFVGDSVGHVVLDEFFKDKDKPTFLKMDVEGAEPLVLRGMEDMLRDSRLPMRLAICTYHRQEDAPWIASFLGDDFDKSYSNSYYWHMSDPIPPFLRRGVMRAVKKKRE